jgi:hypothetical protein
MSLHTLFAARSELWWNTQHQPWNATASHCRCICPMNHIYLIVIWLVSYQIKRGTTCTSRFLDIADADAAASTCIPLRTGRPSCSRLLRVESSYICIQLLRLVELFMQMRQVMVCYCCCLPFQQSCIRIRTLRRANSSPARMLWFYRHLYVLLRHSGCPESVWWSKRGLSWLA